MISIVERFFWREPVLGLSVGCLVVLIPPTAVAVVLDDRMVDGVNVWIKPLKFEVSLAVFLATVLWATDWLPAGVTERLDYRLYSISIAACVALEMGWIALASALGVRSHFNVEQSAWRVIYPWMGFVAMYLTSIAAVYGVLIIGSSDPSRPAAMRLAVGLGFLLTFALTLVVAGALATSSGASLGGSPHGSQTPIVGWRRDGPDLRAAHFLATHAAVIIPVVSWLILHWVSAGMAFVSVWVVSSVFSATVGLFFLEAIRGHPVWSVFRLW
ncbi:MAG: hypothetical protein AAFQ65_12700 [Myxococcota bacterium]